MRKFVIVFTTIVVSIIADIVLASMGATSVAYAQNTTLQGADYNPTTLMKKLHNNIIIDAINAKIRSVYDGNGEKLTSDYKHIK